MYRSLLYVPAHAARFLGKAHERGADAIILDLEDAVPEVDKDRAREGLVLSVPQVGRGGATVFVRINSGPRATADAKAAKASGAAGLLVAKADLAGLAALAPIDIPLLAMIESPAGVLDARACAAAKNVMGLLVGGEDLATALGGRATPDVLRVPKLLVHYAARAEGKLSFGLLRSVADYSDLEGISAAAQEARAHGFDGATCVHPSAVPVLNAAFMPSEEELGWARRVIEGASAGDAAFSLDGQMVDKPIVERARRLLARAAGRPKDTR